MAWKRIALGRFGHDLETLGKYQGPKSISWFWLCTRRRNKTITSLIHRPAGLKIHHKQAVSFVKPAQQSSSTLPSLCPPTLHLAETLRHPFLAAGKAGTSPRKHYRHLQRLSMGCR